MWPLCSSGVASRARRCSHLHRSRCACMAGALLAGPAADAWLQNKPIRVGSSELLLVCAWLALHSESYWPRLKPLRAPPSILPFLSLSWDQQASWAVCRGSRLHLQNRGGAKTSRGAHLRNFEGHPVPLPQLLQLSYDTVCDAGLALRVQAVHHSLHQVDLRGHTSIAEM